MAAPEHVSAEQSLDHPRPSSPSWTEDGGIEEVGEVGVAVTTSEDEEVLEEDQVGIALGGDDPSPSIDYPHRGLGSEPEHEASGADAEEKERGLDVDVDVDVDVGVDVDVDADGGRSALGSASQLEHSRSRSGTGSRSRSHSSSVGVAESSVATSWTQVESKRPSGDSEQQRSEDRARSMMKEVVERVVQEEEEKAKARMEGTAVVSPPDVMRREEVLVMQEQDIGEAEAEKVEGGEADVGSVRASLEADEKGRSRTFGSIGRNTRHLRLEFKQPSPQPWDVADPPTENNETYTTDYYSTLNSKKFETLQKRQVPRRRPLIPRSSYYFGPPPPGSAFGSAPVGQMGVHHPREVVRIERDYGGGELVQFSPVFPLELEGRITPTQFHQTINDINEILISAHSVGRAFVDNLLAVFTLQLSTLVTRSHYTREMRRLKEKIEEENNRLYNPAGLNILWPQKVAFLFLEIEYY